MLTFYRIDHIGQVVPDLEPQLALFEGLFGFRPARRWKDDALGCNGVMLDVPGSWGHRWEVLAPSHADSPMQMFLNSPLGPGIHHVAVEVPNLDDAIEAMERLGIDAGRRAPGPDDRFIDIPFVPTTQASGLTLRVFGPASTGVCGSDGLTPAEESSPMRGATDESDTLGIVAIEQIGHAYPDRNELAAWLETAAGMREVYRTPEGEHPDIATLVLTIPGAHMRWEIIQPVDSQSFVQRFLDKRGPLAHHVTFEIRDWERAMVACDRHGIPTFGENRGVTSGARWRDTFIHPRHTGGFLAQLFWEERPGAWSRSDKTPRPRG
ncbi:MAG: VOC family protein [Parvularculaceae bacterium]